MKKLAKNAQVFQSPKFLGDMTQRSSEQKSKLRKRFGNLGFGALVFPRALLMSNRNQILHASRKLEHL